MVVPTYNRCASVLRLLRALRHQTLNPAAFEVLIAVDGCLDTTAEAVAEFAAPFPLRALLQPHRGRAAACNSGILASRAEIALLLDDDMEPAEDLLLAHLRAHAGRPGRAVLGAVPISFTQASPPIVQYIGRKFEHHMQKLSRPDYAIGFRDFYSGNCSIARSVLLEVGLFDEEFQVYGNEDGELARRLLHHQVALAYCPEALARQHYEKDFARVARDSMEKGHTAVLFAAKYPDAYEKLALSTGRHGARSARALRAALLMLGTVYARTPATIIRVVEWFERRQSRRLNDCYRFVLDYFFWAGVRAARRGGLHMSNRPPLGR